MDPKLVPLRIPPGWMIDFNNFTEADPDKFTNDEYKYVWEFDEDILQFSNRNKKRILDLSWYPSFNPNGEYVLKLIRAEEDSEEQTRSWEKPIINYKSRDINKVKDKIEYILEQVRKGKL